MRVIATYGVFISVRVFNGGHYLTEWSHVNALICLNIRLGLSVSVLTVDHTDVSEVLIYRGIVLVQEKIGFTV
jgi:hypothetical protein